MVEQIGSNATVTCAIEPFLSRHSDIAPSLTAKLTVLYSKRVDFVHSVLSAVYHHCYCMETYCTWYVARLIVYINHASIACKVMIVILLY